MELFRTETHFIFVRERHNLWCDRFTGELSAKSGSSVLIVVYFYNSFTFYPQNSFLMKLMHDE